MSRQLRAAGEISDLDKLLERAKLLLTIEEQEKTAAVHATVPSEVVALKEQVSAFMEQVAALVNRCAATHQRRQVCVTGVTSQVICSEIVQI